ncbi:MAG: tRNA (adenosine(37)-N6)-threonylcarbamoyltransferase complex dimerization subunit type 1 TsaB [Pleurocapsa sp.]
MINDKYALALHTTTPQLGIALDNFLGDRRDRVWDLGRDLSAHLHQHLQEILAPQTWQDLAFIAVAKGPGGFTGTRIGVVVARTIAQQLNIPLFGISTLAAAAHWTKPSDSKELLAIQMKARQNQLFVAIYQPNGDRPGLTTYLEDAIASEESWQQTLARLNSPYKLIKADDNLAITVNSVLDLAYERWKQGDRPSWSEILPFYGQNPV